MDPATPYGEAVWSSPAWLREATAWIDERLAAIGRERTGSAELERVRRWAVVVRAGTSEGRVWMKAARPECAIEMELYEPIERAAPGLVAQPLAVDRGRGWLLLSDAGAPPADAAAMAKALESMVPRYAQLQRALAPEAGNLLAHDGADHRPAVLEAVLDDVCAETEDRLRLAGDPDGALSTLEAVRGARTDVARWAQQLDDAPIAPSVDHGDLTPDHVLAGPAGVRILDWGDAVVSHPFATLRLVLDGRPEERLLDAYLELWSDLAGPAELRALAATACRVAPITRAAIILRATRSQPDEAPANPSWATFCVRELSELVAR